LQRHGNADWYVEGRALMGKDVTVAPGPISPFTGAASAISQMARPAISNYRTQGYLYVPLGAPCAQPRPQAACWVSPVEYDHLLRGWNTTRDSLLGGGIVPATSTTPQFSIGDFTDHSFKQDRGWALRASASYPLSRSWSIEPYYVRWRVSDSSVSAGSVALTVNAITVRQTLNAYEPRNVTKEFGMKIGWHFGGR
jgi:hypothetical protein